MDTPRFVILSQLHPPTSSWWTDAPRAHFQARVAAEFPRMRWSRFGDASRPHPEAEGRAATRDKIALGLQMMAGE